MSDSRPTRPRFSLLSLATAMTIVALAVGLFSSALHNRKLEVRNHQLAEQNEVFRNELGIFSDASEEIRAVQLETIVQSTWKWRVYVPAKKAIRVSYAVRNVQPDVDPRLNASREYLRTAIPLRGPAEYFVWASIGERNHKDLGLYKIHVAPADRDITTATSKSELIPENTFQYFLGGNRYVRHLTGRKAISKVDGESLVLLQLEISHGPSRSSSDEGLQVWIDEWHDSGY